MPFKSKAQRRKFYALKSQGKMDQKTIDEWESETPKDLPEKVAGVLGSAFERGQDQAVKEVYEDVRRK